MPSTYVNDLRLEEIATGEQSGTWGVTTNTNLELVAEAFAYATVDPFDTDADKTETMADGATDPIRSLYLKVTSTATLTATRTLTLAPNTVSKVWIIENATTGSQSISISQGSGANVTIPNGDVKVIYTDGAGAGAAVVDAFTDLNLSGDLTVDTDTLYVDSANNRVGIGTSSPQTDLNIVNISGATLDINTNQGAADSKILLHEGTSASPANGASIRYDGAANLFKIGVGSSVDTTRLSIDRATGDISFYDDTGVSQALFWDASAESLGIGTTSPATSLHVNSGANGEILRIQGADAQLRINNSTANVMDINSSGSGDSLTLSTNDTERARIDSSGNVGIGTSSVHSYGGISSLAGNILDVYHNSFGTTAGARLILGANNTAADRPVGELQFGNNSNQIAGIQGRTGTTSTNGQILFSVNQSGTMSEIARFNQSGQLGIGTTSPSDVLHVVKTSGGLNARIESADSNAAGHLYQNITTGTTTGDGLFVGIGSGEQGYMYHYESQPLIFGTAGTENMRLDSSGNLMVGTTESNPTSSAVNVAGQAFSTTGGVRSTVASNPAGTFNRKTDDGNIVIFRKDGTTVGSIGSYLGSGTSQFFIAGADTGFKINSTVDVIAPSDASGGDRDAAIDLGYSSGRFKDLYLSGGVYVGGTTSANYLDDYEEGTWTPAPRPLSGTLSGTIVTEGHYVKIGQLVYLHFYVDIQSISSQTAANDYPVLAGIPFASSSSNSYLDSGVISRNTAFYGSPTATKCFMGGGTIFFGLSQGGTSFPPFAANPPYTTGILSGSITYWTTS